MQTQHITQVVFWLKSRNGSHEKEPSGVVCANSLYVVVALPSLNLIRLMPGSHGNG